MKNFDSDDVFIKKFGIVSPSIVLQFYACCSSTVKTRLLPSIHMTDFTRLQTVRQMINTARAQRVLR